MDREEVARLVELLEGEINNGGFHQFFYNSTGDETFAMIRALKKIGALKTADIVARAAAKFPRGMPPKERVKRQDLGAGEGRSRNQSFRKTEPGILRVSR